MRSLTEQPFQTSIVILSAVPISILRIATDYFRVCETPCHDSFSRKAYVNEKEKNR